MVRKMSGGENWVLHQILKARKQIVVNSYGWTGRKPWPKQKKKESWLEYFCKHSGLSIIPTFGDMDLRLSLFIERKLNA